MWLLWWSRGKEFPSQILRTPPHLFAPPPPLQNFLLGKQGFNILMRTKTFSSSGANISGCHVCWSKPFEELLVVVHSRGGKCPTISASLVPALRSCVPPPPPFPPFEIIFFILPSSGSTSSARVLTKSLLRTRRKKGGIRSNDEGRPPPYKNAGVLSRVGLYLKYV